MRSISSQRGMTLIELVLAMAISAFIMAALNDVVKLGLDAQTAGRGSNELAYQGRFALERINDLSRNLPPKNLSTPTANTTGDWFAPIGCSGAACVMYCRNTNNQLVETITSDTSCTGTKSIAKNVKVFSAVIPANMGAVDRPVAEINMTLSDDNSNSINFTSSIRLGGGAL